MHCGANLPSADSTCARCAFGRLFADEEVEEIKDEEDELPEMIGKDQNVDSGVFRLELDLPGYKVGRYVARGGMGLVYQAEHLALNRTVALKVMASDSLWSNSRRERFNVEAEAVAQLEHPNIVPIYDVGRWKGRPFIAMRWIEGETLNRWLPLQREIREIDGNANDSRGFQSLLRQTVGLLATVTRAVHHAHQRGFLHRDLKPSNIMVDGQGTGFVMDFGLARRLDDSNEITVSGEVLGTPSFMSPEQARGDLKALSVASDVFSLGAILYWILTDQPPFTGSSTGEILKKVETEEPKMPSVVRRVHVDLETICMKCLRKETAARYGSAEEMADDLDRWLRGEPVLARRQNLLERLTSFSRREPMVASLVAGCVLLLSLFVVFLLSSREDLRRAAEAETELRLEAEMKGRIADGHRRQADEQRRAAEDSREQLANTLKQLRIREMEKAFAVGDSPTGLAQLAALVREESESLPLLSRLVGALAVRPWVGAPVWTKDFDSPIRHAVFDEPGHVAVGCADGTVAVYDVTTGKVIGEVLNLDSGIGSLEFAHDINWIVVAAKNGVALIHEFADGKELLRVQVDAATEIQTRLSPDRSMLAVVSRDVVQVFSVPGGKELSRQQLDASTHRAAWMPDSSRFLLGTFKGMLWSFAKSDHFKATEHGRADEIREFAFDPDPQTGWLVTAGAGEHSKIWSREMKPLFAFPQVQTISVDPLGARLALGYVDGNVEIANPREPDLRTRITQVSGSVERLRFSRDGVRLYLDRLSKGRRHGVVIDSNTGELLAEGVRGNGAVDPDLRFAASGVGESILRVWKLAETSKRARTRITQTLPRMQKIVLTQRAPIFATVGHFGSVTFRRFPAGKVLASHVPDSYLHEEKFVDFQHDGSTFLVYGKSGGIVYSSYGEPGEQIQPIPSGSTNGNNAPLLWMALGQAGAFVQKVHADGRVDEVAFDGRLRQRVFVDDLESVLGRNGRTGLLWIRRKSGELAAHESGDLHQVRYIRPPIGSDREWIAPNFQWRIGTSANGEMRIMPLHPTGPVQPQILPGIHADTIKFTTGETELFIRTHLGHAIVGKFGTQGFEGMIRTLAEGVVDGVFVLQGNVLVTISENKRVEFWDTHTGVPIWEPITLSRHPTCLCSPSGAELVMVGDYEGAEIVAVDLQGIPNESSWLPAFAEAVASAKLAPSGELVHLPFEDGWQAAGKLIDAETWLSLPNWASKWDRALNH